jgi:hypothetical protein
MFRTMTAAAALTIVCAPAFSQELSYGSVDLNYSQLSGDGIDLSNTTFGGEVEYSYGQFLLGAGLQTQLFNGSGGDEITITGLNGFVAYAPTTEILVGAGISHAEVDTGGSGGDLSGFEVFAQYRTPTMGAAILYSEPDTDSDDFSITSYFAEAEVSPGVKLGAIVDDFSEFDEAIYYISADYEQGPIAVRGFYNGVTGEDFAIYGVRGTYAVTPMIDVSASIGGFQDYLADEGTTLTVGGSYAVSNDFSIDASIGRLAASDEDVNSFQISLTYEVGASKRLDVGMANAVRDDRNNGLNAAFPNMGFGGTSFPAL